MAEKKPFLRFIHHFRGFAILNVMLVHLWKIPGEYKEEPGVAFADAVRELLFHDSTIYFLFISGFLAGYLAQKMPVLKYYRNKCLYVVLPYVLLSCALFMEVKVRHGMPLGEIVSQLPTVLAHGAAQFQYWYIPFIIPLFLVTPLLLKLPPKTLSLIALGSVVMPLLGTRTGIVVSLGQYIYFTPVYVIGVHAAVNYPRSFKGLERSKWFCVVIAVSSSLVLLKLGVADALFFMGINIIESLFYVQKLALCLLFLALFMNMEERKSPALDQFAVCSFTLYFLHVRIAFMGGISEKFYAVVAKLSTSLLVPLSIVYTLGMCFVLLGISMVLRKILGKYSRYLVGS
jgi:hypothetical protein